ncbi:MAG: hypothetical protein KDB18_10950 [Salinibacterium sp.]|nr:hypothetical protein [Salinibacterium sp.]
MPRPAATFAAGLAVVLLLAGCMPPDPIITPEPGPGATPVFASDEEALAAATDAYAKYRSVLDEIFTKGGNDLSKLATVATGDQLQVEMSSFAEIKNRGLHSTGGTTFTTQGLQQYDPGSPDGHSIVVAYICEDVSSVDVLNSSGESVVSPDRPDTSLYEVAFDLDSGGQQLLVSHKERWSDSPC